MKGTMWNLFYRQDHSRTSFCEWVFYVYPVQEQGGDPVRVPADGFCYTLKDAKKCSNVPANCREEGFKILKTSALQMFLWGFNLLWWETLNVDLTFVVCLHWRSTAYLFLNGRMNGDRSVGSSRYLWESSNGIKCLHSNSKVWRAVKVLIVVNFKQVEVVSTGQLWLQFHSWCACKCFSV